MKIFISWSGERSRYMAKCLKSWLPKVIQYTKPWMSEEDILVGSRWSMEIAQELDDTNYGIICITPENQHKPWILFEAGALSKSLSDGNVSPVIFDMPLGQVKGPLSSFQGISLNKDGIEKLLISINKSYSTSSLKNEEISEILNVWWPFLDKELNKIPDYNEEIVPQRTNDDILEELLVNTRELLRRDNIDLEERIKKSDSMKDEVTRLKEMMQGMSDLKMDVSQMKEDKEKGLEVQKSFIDKLHNSGMTDIMGNMLDGLIDNESAIKKLKGGDEL